MKLKVEKVYWEIAPETGEVPDGLPPRSLVRGNLYTKVTMWVNSDKTIINNRITIYSHLVDTDLTGKPDTCQGYIFDVINHVLPMTSKIGIFWGNYTDWVTGQQKFLKVLKVQDQSPGDQDSCKLKMVMEICPQIVTNRERAGPGICFHRSTNPTHDLMSCQGLHFLVPSYWVRISTCEFKNESTARYGGAPL